MDLKEKYRPKSFNDKYLIKTEQIKEIEDMMPDIPHLLLSGEPGLGKSTIACSILPREMFGDEWQTYTLLLNASDTRGIDMVRSRIKIWATSKSLNGKKRLVILDEADAMTADAQNALRGMMEIYSSNCIFVLTCNNAMKIIPALKDNENGRCMHIIFTLPTEEQFEEWSKNIFKEENIKIEDEVFTQLMNVSKRKVRFFLNTVQKNKNKGDLTKENISFSYKDSDIIFELITRGMLGQAVNKAMELEARTFIKEMAYIIYNVKEINGINLGIKKVNMLNIIAEHDYRLVLGTEKSVQIPNMIYSLAREIIRLKKA